MKRVCQIGNFNCSSSSWIAMEAHSASFQRRLISLTWFLTPSFAGILWAQWGEYLFEQLLPIICLSEGCASCWKFSNHITTVCASLWSRGSCKALNIGSASILFALASRLWPGWIYCLKSKTWHDMFTTFYVAIHSPHRLRNGSQWCSSFLYNRNSELPVTLLTLWVTNLL